MKAIIKKFPQKSFTLIDVPEFNKLNPFEVRVEMIFSGICGTDLHIYQYDNWAKKNLVLPHVNGHEGVGYVLKVGSKVTRVKPKQFVMFESHAFDGTCSVCLKGNFHICLNGGILGVSKPGIWQEKVQIHENHLIVIPDIKKVPLVVWGLSEPAGNAMHTLSYSKIEHQNVVIFGDGPIGLITALIAQNRKPKTLTLVGLNPIREKLAKKWNINYINANQTDFLPQLKNLTKNEGIDVVCEMSGNIKALKTSLTLLNPGGDMNILSLYPEEEVLLPLNEMTFKNVKLQFITGRKIWQTWKEIEEFFLSNPQITAKLEDLITDYFKFTDFEIAFQKNFKQQVGKVYLVFKKELLSNYLKN